MKIGDDRQGSSEAKQLERRLLNVRQRIKILSRNKGTSTQRRRLTLCKIELEKKMRSLTQTNAVSQPVSQ